MRGFGGEAPEKKIIILGTERNFQVLDWVLDWVLDARTSGTGKGGYWVWMPGRRVPVRGGYWVLSFLVQWLISIYIYIRVYFFDQEI